MDKVLKIKITDSHVARAKHLSNMYMNGRLATNYWYLTPLSIAIQEILKLNCFVTTGRRAIIGIAFMVDTYQFSEELEKNILNFYDDRFSFYTSNRFKSGEYELIKTKNMVNKMP